MDFPGVEIKPESEKNLIEVVAEILGSKKKAKLFIDLGLVCVNGRKILNRKFPVKPKDCVSVPKVFLPKVQSPKVLYEDEFLAVVFKPSFWNTNHGERNLELWVRKNLKKDFKAVHRIDKHTSGVVIFAEKKLFDKFVELFRAKLVKKRYNALVLGTLNPPNGKIEIPLDGKEAITLYRTEKRFSSVASLLSVEIPTGRKHQIRRHLSLLGNPVVGEFVYWKRTWRYPLYLSPRIMLHASSVEFEHPVLKKKVSVFCPLPFEFSDFLKFLEKTLEGVKSGRKV